MATAAVTHNFTNGTPADADQVDTNFADLVTFANNQTIHKDGSVAFTAVPSMPATLPSADTHVSNKKYVDEHTKLLSVKQSTADSAWFETAKVEILASIGSFVMPDLSAGTSLVQVRLSLPLFEIAQDGSSNWPGAADIIKIALQDGGTAGPFLAYGQVPVHATALTTTHGPSLTVVRHIVDNSVWAAGVTVVPKLYGYKALAGGKARATGATNTPYQVVIKKG